jgi:hypothetical protein
MVDNGFLLRVLPFLIVGICLLFIILWILHRISVKEMQKEIQSLRNRLTKVKASKRVSSLQAERVPRRNRRSIPSANPAPSHTPASDRQILEDTHTASDVEQNKEQKDSEHAEQSGVGRRVKITKLLGKEIDIKLRSTFVGFEVMPPEEGKGYRLALDDGRMLHTSPVVQVMPRFIETQNSLYELEILEEN